MPLPIPSFLLEQLDIGINHAAGYFLRGLKHLALWLTGLIALAVYSVMVFEYGEGLADISQFEWAFMTLALLLTWRHCHYTRQFGYGFWRGLARWLSAQGIALTVQVSLLGLLILLMLWVMNQPMQWQATANAIDDDDMAFKTYEFIALVVALLAIYLSAPTRPRDATTAQPQQEAVRQEPTVSSTPDKEASL